jgi:hypothetical protein
MKYKVFKYFIFTFKEVTTEGTTFYEIKPAKDTMRLFNERYLIQRKNEGSNDLEVYYPSLRNDFAEPYPKLEIRSELYFVVKYTGSTVAGSINLFGISNENEVPVSIEIRSNKTLIEIDLPSDGNTSLETIIIKTYSGVEIQREILIVQEKVDDGGNPTRHVIFSFDFTNYPFGVYTAELDGDDDPQKTFVIDKTGELKGKYALLRIEFNDDNILGYNLTNEFKKFDFLV